MSLISRQDWWAVAVTLLLSVASYFVGGGGVAFFAIFVGAIITIVLHMSRDTGATEVKFKAPAEDLLARERESLSPISNSEPTLISLMDTSFPHLNKFWGKPVVQFKDGSSLEVKSALYFGMFTTLNDLSYSGKVYLYHQDSLTHKQMAEVEEFFKAQKLNVVLRGPDFLAPAWIAWKQKSLVPPV